MFLNVTISNSFLSFAAAMVNQSSNGTTWLLVISIVHVVVLCHDLRALETLVPVCCCYRSQHLTNCTACLLNRHARSSTLWAQKPAIRCYVRFLRKSLSSLFNFTCQQFLSCGCIKCKPGPGHLTG